MTWAFNYTTICLLDTPVSKVWVCLKCDVQISPPVGMITTYVIGDNYMMGYLQSKNINWFLCLQIHGVILGVPCLHCRRSCGEDLHVVLPLSLEQQLPQDESLVATNHEGRERRSDMYVHVHNMYTYICFTNLLCLYCL